eukprot:7123375-Prymnesium_polylepis.1
MHALGKYPRNVPISKRAPGRGAGARRAARAHGAPLVTRLFWKLRMGVLPRRPPATFRATELGGGADFGHRTW